MVTDKRLDQVSTLTDFDYALIVKDNKVAKVSKQQLSELVGNLLYGATNASSLATVVAGQMKFINFEATCIHVLSTVYVQVIHTNLKNSVFGKYILKTPEGMLSEVLFSSKIDSNGYFSLAFDKGLPIGSTLLLMYGG